MKFIHAADLHIDSPMRGLDDYPGAPVERLRGATRQAFSALVDLALQEQVQLVLLAGDIYDGDWADFRTGLFFREQLLRLHRAGIQTYIVKGNHDAASQITRQLPEVPGVYTFSSRRASSVVLEDLGVAIHGQSFPDRAVLEDLVPSYPAAVPDLFNIGMLHTSLTGREGHDTYAPTTVEMLSSKGYDYFALGHVHKREVVQEAHPRIVFPGNIQGRHARETGPKGCELVTVEGTRIVSSQFVPLDVVRWHVLELDVSGLASVDALARHFLKSLEQEAGFNPDLLHAVRVILQGESPLHTLEAEQPGTLAACLQAASQEADGLDFWVEQVRLNLRTPIDRSTLLQRDDPAGEVARLVSGLSTDPDRLRDWFIYHTRDLKLPPRLASLTPEELSEDDMRALLADAESTVLTHLLQAAQSSND